MHQRRLKHAPASRRIDPETGEVERANRRGLIERREPSAKPIEHMAWDWFPLAVWSGREKLARLMLEDAGLVTFHPVEVRWRNANRYDRARRAKRRIGYPVIPGLIFVGLRKPYPWHIVMAPHVVSHVLSDMPDRPRRLSHEAIGRLLEEKDRGRWIRPDAERWMRTGREFAEGDAVRVVDGPLCGRRLIVHKIEGAMLGAFEIFLGKRQLIWLPLDDAVKDEE